ncbi:unnamed protein product [Lepeophtheirus salmonis]|uniref:(salmon louse) hypothetical protein n=1 Tax=Lepeophtheirus salmonis TaxID=72036 RepID=A0A7R8CEU6_LEPSM|nr:unnamed protein product [Lepeophtheirus salmonis]CAF2799290.1 unnamed protein product [Lepeophtheirus salmonis]
MGNLVSVDPGVSNSTRIAEKAGRVLKRRVKIRKITFEIDLSYSLVFNIIHDYLHIGERSSRWTPGILTGKYKGNYLNMTSSLKKLYADHGNTFLESLVKMDESIVLHSTPENKEFSKQWLPVIPAIKAKEVECLKK